MKLMPALTKYARQLRFIDLGLLVLAFYLAFQMGLSPRKTVGLIIIIWQVVAPLPVVVWGWIGIGLLAVAGAMLVSGDTLTAAQIVENLYYVIALSLLSLRNESK